MCIRDSPVAYRPPTFAPVAPVAPVAPMTTMAPISSFTSAPIIPGPITSGPISTFPSPVVTAPASQNSSNVEVQYLPNPLNAKPKEYIQKIKYANHPHSHIITGRPSITKSNPVVVTSAPAQTFFGNVQPKPRRTRTLYRDPLLPYKPGFKWNNYTNKKEE